VEFFEVHAVCRLCCRWISACPLSIAVCLGVAVIVAATGGLRLEPATFLLCSLQTRNHHPSKNTGKLTLLSLCMHLSLHTHIRFLPKITSFPTGDVEPKKNCKKREEDGW
jgi:hypothetical protein